MTSYEIARLLAEPFLPVVYSKVRRDLRQLLELSPHRPASVLDVGGRKSPYTIGLPAVITILELPRVNEVQKCLHLGVTNEILKDLKSSRSNIREVILQDMTKCSLPSCTFDGIVCIEVIEHVQNDEAFVDQIVRVLKPGGWVYLTTPNGDYVRNEPPYYNPDHVRHYRRRELWNLLNRFFYRVEITYGIKTGKYRYQGLQSINLRHPIRSVKGMVSNVINRLESRELENQARRTAHLFAVGWKAEA